MNTPRRHFASRLLSIASAVGLVATIGFGAATAHAQEKKTLTIGATAGSNFDQLKLGIKPVLEKKGYTVKLVEFNDYVQPNLARALVFLEANKLIKVKAGLDPLKVTEKDVAENPRKLVLTPIEAAQLPRTLDDAEFALINGNFAISSGLKLTEAVVLEKTPDHYLNVVAVKADDKDKPWAKDIAAAFRTPEYRAALDKHFAGYARPAYLQ